MKERLYSLEQSIIHEPDDFYLYKDDLLGWIDILKKEPVLNDDQQVVLGWLKKKIDSYPDVSYLIGDLNYFAVTPVGQAWKRLSKAEHFQVLAAFAEWGLSTLDN